MKDDKHQDPDLRAKLDPVPRELGLGIRLRFLICGRAGWGWVTCLGWLCFALLWGGPISTWHTNTDVLMQLGIAVACAAWGGFYAYVGIRSVRLLISGLVAVAKLQHVQKKVASGGDPGQAGGLIYDLTFSFHDAGGKMYIERLHEVSQEVYDRLVDEEGELLLYDSVDPEKRLLLDQIPFDLTIARPGAWDPLSDDDTMSVLAWIVIHAVLVAAVGALAVYRGW